MELSISSKLVKIKRTIIVYEINNPFKPSIKLLPLTNISKQKAEKKHAKILLFKNKSKNSILDETTLISEIITNDKINMLWIKILFFGETKIFLSEKKPIKNINITKKFNIKSFKKYVIGINKKNPPVRGTFRLLENDWWVSPE